LACPHAQVQLVGSRLLYGDGDEATVLRVGGRGRLLANGKTVDARRGWVWRAVRHVDQLGVVAGRLLRGCGHADGRCLEAGKGIAEAAPRRDREAEARLVHGNASAEGVVEGDIEAGRGAGSSKDLARLPVTVRDAARDSTRRGDDTALRGVGAGRDHPGRIRRALDVLPIEKKGDHVRPSDGGHPLHLISSIAVVDERWSHARGPTDGYNECISSREARSTMHVRCVYRKRGVLVQSVSLETLAYCMAVHRRSWLLLGLDWQRCYCG
jgi:hypothetical protein